MWAPCVPTAGKRSPLGAPSWRFLAPRPCSPLFGIPSGFVRRPHSPYGPYCPEDRVLGPPQARLQPQPHPPDSHGLAPPYGIASRKLPSWARLGRYINDLQPRVKLYLRFASDPDMCIEVRLRSLN